jgi:hypothetical protein
MSDAQPELGLGVVLSVDDRSVLIAFTAADETRRYALRSAPLRRVRFAAGDVVEDHEGRQRTIEGVVERDRSTSPRKSRAARCPASFSPTKPGSARPSKPA